MTSSGTFSVPGEKLSTALTPAARHLIDHVLGRFGRHRDHRDVDALAATHLLQVLDVVDRHAAARLLADLGVGAVEERDDLEAFLAEARVVGQRQAEVAGADDGDAQLAVEAEDLSQMPLQILDVVADAAHAELAEVGQVLADLRGVQVELLGERLRRDGLDAGGLELVRGSAGKPRVGWS